MSASLLAVAWPWIRRVLLIVVGTYLVLGLLAWVFQRRLIYFPDAGPVDRPGGAFWKAVQELDIATQDGETLKAWYLPGERPVTVLIFHGNAGHRGHRSAMLEKLHGMGYGVLLPDYRGYGGSTGEPHEDGLYEDARACRAWLDANTDAAVVYLGNSIGSGVAVELATKQRPAALILRSAFSSFADVGQAAYPFFYVRPFLRERYESSAKIGAVDCPLLCVHGDRDRIIPERLGRKLFEAANEPKRWLTISGVGHNDLEFVGGKVYWTAVKAFLRKHVES